MSRFATIKRVGAACLFRRLSPCQYSCFQYMSLFALGINHTTADVSIREKVAFAPTEIGAALASARQVAGLEEVSILSTCNRMELYCDISDESARLLHWLADYKAISAEDLQPVSYSMRGADAVRHMMRVAAGLDSMVLGEPQILGQMKSCYAVAKEERALGGVLHDAFQRVFSVAKRVRSETAIGENPVSVAYAAVSLARQIFSDLKQDTALLIGAGETIELVARHLLEQGIKKIIVANRTLENAKMLADQLRAEAILLAEIPKHLYQADIVIASTASQLPILGKGAVEQALKKRKHKPMFMLDIAVPRDIEEQVDELSDVFLYTVDDLKEVIDENKRSREQAANIAHDIIDESVIQYERDLRSFNAVNAVKSFRQSMEAISQIELERSLKSLNSGGDPKIALQQLARGLTNKFMHLPTSQVKKASADGRQDIIRSFQHLFQLALENEDDSSTESQNVEKQIKDRSEKQ